MTGPVARFGMGDINEAVRRGLGTLRHPRRTLRNIAGCGPLYPLLILFGLNAVD